MYFLFTAKVFLPPSSIEEIHFTFFRTFHRSSYAWKRENRISKWDVFDIKQAVRKCSVCFCNIIPRFHFPRQLKPRDGYAVRFQPKLSTRGPRSPPSPPLLNLLIAIVIIALVASHAYTHCRVHITTLFISNKQNCSRRNRYQC